MPAPKTSEVLKLFRQHFPNGAHSMRRFPTGLAHYVYEVMRRDGDPVVMRMADRRHWNGIPGGVYWHGRLKPLGVPLPDLIAYDLDSPYPYMLLERLPGSDLGGVYPSLSPTQKQILAQKVAAIQDIVARLPHAKWYGWLNSYENPSEPYDSWRATLASGMDEAERLITAVGVFDPVVVDRVRKAAVAYEPYFAEIPPAPFLDDTTTKNVLVHNGVLTGIVDVDNVCFGDRLAVLGLTQMALLSDGSDTDYVEYWAEAWALSSQQRRIVDLYTAMNCVYFMGEVGQAFNKDRPEPVDPARVAHLKNILEMLLGRGN